MTEATEDIKERVIFCARKGWLYSDASNKDKTVCYFFASKLHQWWVQWKLFLDDRWAGNVEEDNIVDFTKKVLQRFDQEPSQGSEKSTARAQCSGLRRHSTRTNFIGAAIIYLVARPLSCQSSERSEVEWVST